LRAREIAGTTGDDEPIDIVELWKRSDVSIADHESYICVQ